MFGDIARELSKFGIFFHEALHVRDRFQIEIALTFGGELLHVVFRILTQVAKVKIHVLLEEYILVLGENNLLWTCQLLVFERKRESHAFISGLMSGTELRSTRPFLMPSSS